MYRNRSIAEAVRRTLDLDGSFQDGLERGYANLSALARLMRPKVEKFVGSRVKLDTIITSLKRMRGSYRQRPSRVAEVIARSRVSLRTDVSRLSLKRSTVTLKAVRLVMSRYQRIFLQVLEGPSAVTLIYDNRIHGRVRRLFQSSDILAEDSDLAAITLISPQLISATPGCVAVMLQQMSRRGLNVEEVLSCYTDTLIVVRLVDAGKAFDALSELLTVSRQLVSGK